MRDLGNEEGEELVDQPGLLEAVVESEGLDGKSPPAPPAEKALDEAAVALTAVAAVESVGKVALGARGAVRMRADLGQKTHGVLLPEARLGLGQRGGLRALRAVSARSRNS